MSFQKKKRTYGKKKHYSVVNKLLREEKINERFLGILNYLSLEELIALKLEMAAKSSGGDIFGIPIWNSLRDICRDAALKFALSATRTRAEAATFLGISISTFKDYVDKYDIKTYFEEDDNETV
jgi:hypothetical protein